MTPHGTPLMDGEIYTERAPAFLSDERPPRTAPSNKHVPFFPPPPEWMREATCLDHGDLFASFYEDGAQAEVGSSAAVMRAKRICSTCPVKDLCLDFAMDMERGGYRFGIFGGRTPGERADLAGEPAVVVGSHDALMCKNGHERTVENTYYRKGKGTRLCRTCQANSERRRSRLKRAQEAAQA